MEFARTTLSPGASLYVLVRSSGLAPPIVGRMDNVGVCSYCASVVNC